MIAVFHTDILYPHSLDLIKNFGDFGVNIFFAVSGFSMCYAWRKNTDSLTFLKSRFLRILVTVLPVSIVWNVLSYFTHE
jgi:peptidoglycan/LPS O-acetylase OafA/YrhL